MVCIRISISEHLVCTAGWYTEELVWIWQQSVGMQPGLVWMGHSVPIFGLDEGRMNAYMVCIWF
jgi:hypothetical protein